MTESNPGAGASAPPSPEARPLRALLEGEPLMPDRAIELMCQLAEGLAEVHEKGEVYRDLRPENVLVAATPTGERATLAGGLARPAPTSAEGATVMLEAVGAPQYLSPEQLKGATPDLKSDLYSFGVVSYELLSGRLPSEPLGAPKTPLAEAAPHLVDNKKLLELVARCLEEDPSKRPATARELALKLGRVPQVGEPTILMEAISLLPPALPRRKPAAQPPPLPAVGVAAPPLAAPAAPEAGAAAPRPLLASVVMPSDSVLEKLAPPSPLLDPRPLAPEPPPKLKVVKVVALTLLAVGAVIGLALGTRTTPADEARKLLEGGKPREAIDILKVEIQQNQKRSDPTVLALLAVAMHQLDQHRDEEKVFRDEIAPRAPELLDPLVLGGLLEDLGKKEDGAPRELLKRMPKEPLYAVLKPIAEGDPSPRQWGALRYLDLEGTASELDLVKLYVAALDSPACGARRVAAKRLGQLGDKFAEEALSKLKAAPKTEEPCGQAEAAAALGQLGKKKPESP